ncbi:MAG: hypothetical protein IJS01_02200 [Lentisphaeria bacterium]|nr:hypothetical protein [Lentisphaeria bacterium]
MKNNTVVTAGDRNYLWGIFLMIASLRRNGMDEPVIVGVKNFDAESSAILTAMGDVRLFPLDDFDRSLTCCKARVMLQADTDYITWADSDGFFSGNCSARLIPETPEEIHIRMRSEAEQPQAFKGYTYGEDGRRIPQAVLDVWKKNVGGLEEPRIPRSCSACFLSVHRSARPFLEKWHEQMMTVLPANDVGVVDPSLKYYHQLDESVLNSCLAFFPGAPRVAGSFRLNKDPKELFIHFIGQPKPWQGWAPSAFRHFDRYVSVVEFAQAQGWRMPGEIPFSLKRKNRQLCSLLQYPVSFKYKIRKRLRKWFA